MSLEDKIEKNNQRNLKILERLANTAVKSMGLVIWGIDITGGVKPVVRIFVDTEYEGKTIPFVRPLSREEKSKKKVVHPKMMAEKIAGNAISQQDNDQNLDSDNAGAENVSAENVSAENVSAENVSAENVSIDQCAKISRLLGLALEVEDIFPDAFILEVSSPGLERTFYKIEQLKPYLGHPIDVALHTIHPEFENRKKFKGTLKSVNSQSFDLEFEEKIYEIEWETIKRVRLIHVFPEVV